MDDTTIAAMLENLQITSSYFTKIITGEISSSAELRHSVGLSIANQIEDIISYMDKTAERGD